MERRRSRNGLLIDAALTGHDAPDLHVVDVPAAVRPTRVGGAHRPAEVHRFLAVGWLWYLGTLVPVIGLVQVGFQAMADRYTYIPLIGIFIILVWGGADALGNWHFGKMVLAGLAVTILSALTVCTYFQLGYWKNRIALFSHALKVTDNNYVAHNNLGVAFFEKGKFDEAIFHYKEILKIIPDDAGAFYNLGNAMLSSENIDQALFIIKRL